MLAARRAMTKRKARNDGYYNDAHDDGDDHRAVHRLCIIRMIKHTRF